MDSIDFVSSNNERCFRLFEDVDGFNGLRLQTFHDVNNKNCNVCKSATTVSQRCEGVVAGCIDEQKTGRFERTSSHQFCTRFIEYVSRNFGGSNVLSNPTSFSIHNAGLSVAAEGANQIQYACFPVINVTKNGNNRLSILTANDRLFFVRVCFVHATTSKGGRKKFTRRPKRPWCFPRSSNLQGTRGQVRMLLFQEHRNRGSC